jgi:hypothetical protein
MPRRLTLAPNFEALLANQDFLITRDQALAAGLSRHGIENRKQYDGWQTVLPNVYLTHPGELTRRQMLIAALLWAGPDAAIDAADACWYHGMKAVARDEDHVYIAVPADSFARSTGFVVVRRTSVPIRMVRTARLRYVDPATAVIAATRRMSRERQVLAALSDALQRRICSEHELMRAHVQASPRNAALADSALAALGSGARSVPEVTFKELAEASSVLPPLLYNCLLRLPSGQLISPDALAEDAGVVHETNGKKYHKREDLFEDMQERHEVMTVAGLVVLHNTPRQLWTNGRRIIAGFEACYARNKGRGLPPGVVLLRRGPSSADIAG